ncbi:ribonucleotide reductase [Thermoleophilia bacterium SCSIO 60948]|nr:ribonucleotide reductase [Thermoleophilia bacterium SCSIO 60948]
MTRLPRYADFPGIAERSRWDADEVELVADAKLWHHLPCAEAAPIAGLLAGFLLGERAVAADIRPFHEQAPNDETAACFALQALDEDRHRRFFERVHAEVLGEAGDTALRRARQRVPEAFVALFEDELGDAAARLAGDAGALVPAVALYHGLLEGVVFLAGQAELLVRLEGPGLLAGVAEGVRRVQRDERWHVAFGARLLADAQAPFDAEAFAGEGQRALDAWGPLVRREVGAATLADLRRRLLASAAAA